MIYDEINNPQVRKNYYEGKMNFLVRIWWYEEQGLDILNKFRYLIIFIGALAVMLRVEQNLKWMGTVFIIAVPVLAVIGYLWVRFGAKTTEYLNLKKATHFSQYNLKLQEKQLEVLTKLEEKLK